MKIGDFRFDAPAAAAPTPRAAAAAVRGETIVSRFSASARRHADRIAIADAAGAWTYAGLEAAADRVARFVHGLALGTEAPVALLFERSRHFVAAALGVLKAGGVFVPVDPGLPLERQRQLLDAVGARLLIGHPPTLRNLHRLQWRCPALEHVLCTDTANVDALTEAPGSLMSTELWEHLAGEAADDVLAGGWKSAFTGDPLPAEALAAFGENARRKTAPVLAPGARVLEIGCASGFTMLHVAPAAATYLATDIARMNVERTERNARRAGLAHVGVRQLAAHDIDVFPAASFDLIVLNSVVESFPGYGYLRAVLDKAAALLAPGGALFLGNVWDLDRRDAYLGDLADFARRHAAEGARTRLDLEDDLFVPRAFLEDWAAEHGATLSTSAIDAPGFEPAAYAYDAVLHPGAGARATPRRRRHDDRALAGGPAAECGAEVQPAHGAYIIFTSGTTGVPKGVLVEHRSVVGLADAVNDALFAPMRAGAPLAVAALAPFAFDASVIQLFPALLAGETVHLADEGTRRDPARLHAFLEEREIALCDLTPSQFGMLADHWHDRGLYSRVSTYVLGGEVVSESLLRRFYALPQHADIRVVNAYGPTEACVCATLHPMTSASWQAILPVPIGAPLAGVAVRVCDRAGRLLPPGVPGEIHIGGAGVARGYIGDPRLTASRFFADAEGRWYRTGDLGRWVAGGALQFLGREDRQVKIRGNRIELGEIESALAASPNVRQAAVVAWRAASEGDRALHAYVVVEPGFDVLACKATLEAQLPAFMMPASMTVIDALPLTANGKLDEARLPVPARATPAAERPSRPLATETERRLAAVWREVLDVPVEDGEANFFELGGHSVLAVKLMSAVERTFAVRLPLSDLFAFPTVGGLAGRLDAHDRAPRQPVVAINADGTAVPLVCFHPVGGNVLCYKALADALGPDQPVYMVEALGLEEGEPLMPTVEQMVDAYLAALRRQLSDAPLVLAGWSFGGLLAYEAASRLQRAGADVRAVMLFDAIAAPDVVRELLRKDEADYLAILFDELGTLDANELRGLGPEERLDLLIARGRAGDFLPEGTDRNAMRRLLAVFQNNALACVRYQPPPIEGDILLVRPKRPSKQAPGVPGDDLNGWGALPSGGVTLRWMEGTHGQMLVPPYIEELAGHIREYLGRRPG